MMQPGSRSLQGKSALITGASRGIGAACARAFLAAGATVTLAARDGDALAAFAHEPADIITTPHETLIEFIRMGGLARADAPVEPHAQVEHVSGKHAIGILPLCIGHAAERVTNVPTALPVSRQWTELASVEEQIQYLAGDVFSYRVHILSGSEALDG